MKVIGGLIVLVFFAYTAYLYLVPSHLRHRSSSFGGAATANMKAAIFASQVQFQAGCYIDDNKNGIGEYGFFNQMAGDVATHKTKKGELKFIVGHLAEAINQQGITEASHYSFQIFLPDGRGGYYDFESYQKDPDKALGASEREHCFLAVAWPNEIHTTLYQEIKIFFNIENRVVKGRRGFFMFQDGHVRSTSIIKSRDAFMANPSWEHIFKKDPITGKPDINTIDEDLWPYYSK